MLIHSVKELDVKNRIYRVFIEHGNDEMDSLLSRFLEIYLNTIKSTYGVFDYENSKGAKKKIVIDNGINFENNPNDTDGLVPQNGLEPGNGPGLLNEHYISYPVVHNSFNGCILAARGPGYNVKDHDLLKSVSSLIAPILHIKLKNDMLERYRKAAEDRIWESNVELMEKQKEIERANRALDELNHQLQRDQDLAESVFANILNSIPTCSTGIESYFKPMKKVSGDLFLNTPVFVSRQYFFLGDFTGHGLSAAIGAIPVSEIFRKIKDNTHSIGEICSKMNRQLNALLPIGLFLCARLIELDYAADKIHVWSSGLPDLIIRGEGRIRSRVSSNHSPMGVLSHENFDSSAQTVNIEDGDYIYLFSDGLTEAENKKGEMFTQERIEKILANSGNSGSIVNRIIDEFNRYCHGAEQTDDISLVEIEYRSNDRRTRS